MKDLEISKELLSEVLELDVTNYKYPSFGTYIDYSKLYVIYKKENIEYSLLVNIYEFAFKCKEWALTKGYFIYSTNELSFIKSFSLETIETFSNGKDTEIECIIKACEWLLKEQNNDTK